MDSDTEDAFYTEPPRAAWQIVDIVDRDPKEHRKVWYDWYGNMSVSRRHHEKQVWYVSLCFREVALQELLVVFVLLLEAPWLPNSHKSTVLFQCRSFSVDLS